MKVKTKKQNPDGIVRLETSGDIKEIIINEDLLSPKDAKINLCFRGKSSSGIIELSPKEVETLYKEVRKRMQILGNIEIMKFKK